MKKEHTFNNDKDLMQSLVKEALLKEYGDSFTLNPGFAKMVKTISTAFLTDPSLKKDILSVI